MPRGPIGPYGQNKWAHMMTASYLFRALPHHPKRGGKNNGSPHGRPTWASYGAYGAHTGRRPTTLVTQAVFNFPEYRKICQMALWQTLVDPLKDH